MKSFLLAIKEFFIKKNFLATKITAASLAIIIVAVSVLFAFAGGESVLKVIKKKKVIRRHPNNESSVSDTLDDNDEYDYDDWVALEDFEDVSSEEDDDEEPSEIYEVELDGKGYSDANGRIACGFYHYFFGDWERDLGDYYGNEMDFMTTGFLSIDALYKAKENNCVVWMNINNPFPNRETLDIYATDLMSQYDEQIQAIKDSGLWDYVAGFHFDEPCTKMTGEQFKVLTKYLSETYPGKRIFPVLSTYEIYNNGPQGTIIGEMNYENYGYVTDIAFDWYDVQGVSIENYRTRTKDMLEALGRDNVRVWFFPATFEWYGNTEDDMITHLNWCYELLKEQKYPGGLLCYTWGYYNREPMGSYIDPNGRFKYFRLAERFIEIAKEIKNNPYRYNQVTTIN